MLADKIYTNVRSSDLRRPLEYVVQLTGIAIIYIGLAKLSLALASIHPSATPIWPPTGYALGAVLLLGYRVSPAIFLGALVANATTAGSISTALAIAAGNTLESLIGTYFINRWSDGRSTFDLVHGKGERWGRINSAPVRRPSRPPR
jgi:integral membrane sensor domain MASE1